MKNALIVAAVLSMPIAYTVAGAQTSGVSHPDQAEITTSSDGAAQNADLQPSIPATQNTTAPALHTHAATNVDQTTSSRTGDGAFAKMGAYTATGQASALPDVDGEIVTRLPGPSNQLPVGTLISARIREAISTETTVQGSSFTASLTEPILRDGAVLLPAGSVVSGRVSEVHGGKRITGPAAIHLQPVSVTLPDGTRYPLRGQVIDTGVYNHTKVDSEGTILRRDHAKATVSELGLATGAGAAAGAVFGGVPGALIGGAVGAGVGTTVWLKQDKETEVPAQTLITFSLNEPLTVGGR